jgi:gamma-tubulin complex component 3
MGPGGESEAHALLLRHLDVTLVRTPGGSGWDAFCLDYNTGSPCDAVLTAGAMRLYKQASTFLWRLKRVEYTLTAVWRKHCTTARLVPHLFLDASMHKCYLLRHEMVHFVYNLQYYLMFEVIECAWVQLDESLSGATDLEGVLEAHNAFLGDIERKAMLRREDERMHLALKALFDSILQFARAQDVLYMSLLEQKAAQKAHLASVGVSEAKGKGWGARGGVSDAQLGKIHVEKRLAEQLVASANDYTAKFAAFFGLVMRHSSYDLSFLCFRLDFNEYYESLEAHRASLQAAPLQAAPLQAASPQAASLQAEHADGGAAEGEGAGTSPLRSPT